MRYKGLIAILGLGVLLAVVVACGGGLSEEDVETRAQELADQMVAEMATGERLAAIQERGVVICASRNDVPGYGSLDAAGNNVGFDIRPVPGGSDGSARRPERHRDPADHGGGTGPDDPVG